MFRRTRHTIRRTARPGLALVLVLAQVVSAFGFPVVRARGVGSSCAGGECGCDTGGCGLQDGCCCGEPAPRPAPRPEPCGSCGTAIGACCCEEPAPEPDDCPSCRVKALESIAPPAPQPLAVKWVFALKARQCRGEGPQGLLAEVPAVPVTVPAGPCFNPTRVGVVAVFDDHSVVLPRIPLDPPPRAG